MEIRFSLGAGLCACLCAVLSCGCARQESVQKIAGFAQGSYYAITYYAAQEALSAEKLQPAVDSLLQAFDLCASLWNENSEICRVNRNEDFAPSAMFCDMFDKAQQVSELTGGAFDITVSPLVKRYGFSKKDKNEAGGKAGTLCAEELAEILRFVGWEKVRIENGRVLKSDARLQLDFNAIAQGYASDLVSRMLDSLGISRYLVDVGGEIRARGRKPNGDRWVVGIEKPAGNAMDDRVVMTRMYLEDQSLVTSGNYRKYFEENGKRYSHTIDPKTGRSVQHNLLSATVLCEDCWEADALATACMVLGVDSAQAFLSRHAGYEGFLIYADSTGLCTWHTEGFPLFE
ncbi:MAG: FAD:protein FMN transferase [Bacteroidales bacterium]|nr:FAD:protein FMN transferase [Bacteroidales bacterium]